MSISCFQSPLRRQFSARFICSTTCLSTRNFRNFVTAVTQSPPSFPEETFDNSEAQVHDNTESQRAVRRKPRKRSAVNLLERTKVEEHLAAIRAASAAPLTLEDIERYRPNNVGNSDAPQYEAEYRNLLETLLNSFNKKQLRKFGQIYGLDGSLISHSRTKEQYAKAIVEKQWGWPSLAEVQMRKESWIATTKSFPLDPRQTFLLLGKDGSDLLTLSASYDVHVTLSSNPLALKVSGLRSSLDKLGQYINSMKKGFQEFILDLPSGRPLPAGLLQRISRLAGAFVENFGDPGKVTVYPALASVQDAPYFQVRISARDSRALNIASRLAIRASNEAESSGEHPTVSYLPAGISSTSTVPASLFPHTYSVYPFLTSRALPWSVTPNGSFRIRRVGEWIGVDHAEDISKTGGLAAEHGRFLANTGDEINLKQLLTDSIKPADLGTARREFRATIGHGLVMSSFGGKGNIIPPLKGYWQYPSVLDWIKTHNVKHLFIPSMPTAFLGLEPKNQRVLHRVVYRSHAFCSDSLLPLSSRKTIKFEVVLGQPTSASPSTQRAENADEYPVTGSRSTPEDHHSTLHLPEPSDASAGLESSKSDPRADSIEIAGDNGSRIEDLSTNCHGDLDSVPKRLSLDLPGECMHGTDSYLNVVMPDRPMDIQFSASQNTILPTEEWPSDLQDYLKRLRSFLTYEDQESAQPECPTLIEHDGCKYILQSSTTVRQSVQEAENDLPIQTVTESILDLDSDERSTICQVVCSDVASSTTWTEFLAKCDKVTVAAPTRKILPLTDTDL